MGSPVQKRSAHIPWHYVVSPLRETCVLYALEQKLFSGSPDELSLDTNIPFESWRRKTPRVLDLIQRSPVKQGYRCNPRSIIWKWGSRGPKCHRQIFALSRRHSVTNRRWTGEEGSGNSWGLRKNIESGCKKVLDCSCLLSMTRHHLGLEFLVSRLSMESHMLIAS